MIAADNWPQFRGPGARGISDERDLPEVWSKSENVAWVTKIAGRGWSSPIVWGDKVFITSAIQVDGKAEKVKTGLYFGGDRKTPKVPYRYIVVCLDFNTGKVLWEKTAFEGVPKFGHHLKNSMASETPVTDGERIYAYFGNVGLFAYDLDGNQKWTRELGSYPMALNWGTASSPALSDGRLYVIDDNEKHSFLSAIDAVTGQGAVAEGSRREIELGNPLRVEERKTNRDRHLRREARSLVRHGRQLAVGAVGDVVDRHPHALRGRWVAVRDLGVRPLAEEAAVCDQAGGIGRHFAQRGQERDVQRAHRLVQSQGRSVQRLARAV